MGRIHGGAEPDPFGLATFVFRDFAMNPIPGASITLDFSAACDISLCGAVINGKAVEPVDGTVSGTTDDQGRLRIIVLGAANVTGTCATCKPSPGGGLNDVEVFLEGTPACFATAVCLDQNGASPQPGPGVNAVDLAVLAKAVAQYQFTLAYRGRADISANGTLNGLDLSHLGSHIGRLQLSGGTGCAPYAPGPPCP